MKLESFAASANAITCATCSKGTRRSARMMIDAFPDRPLTSASRCLSISSETGWSLK